MGLAFWKTIMLLNAVTIISGRELIQFDVVRKWSEKIGEELKHVSQLVTRREEVLQSFRNPIVKESHGEHLILAIAQDLRNMFALKEIAVRKIAKKAEEVAYKHRYDKISQLQYNNMTMEVPVSPNKRFYGIPVNTCQSAILKPHNVYDNVTEVVGPIKWSTYIDSVFMDNYAKDTSLYWQYFGTFLGITRQFPATVWNNDTMYMYDCRVRPWYVQAASSQKDIVILVDNSGSMTGTKHEIAKQVVTSILDTLGDNDFVNVFNYTDDVGVMVPCFSDRVLVQANYMNIFALKEGLKTLHPNHIANLTRALTLAFSLLKEYREEKKGSCCNQAIMLITDELTSNYTEIFESYNLPALPVRIFTYLTGDHGPDISAFKWMACENRGYFATVKSASDARNQVAQYISVMARPMVLKKRDNPKNWSPMYADLEVMNAQKNKMDSMVYTHPIYLHKEEEYAHSKYRFVTSVSMPAYDRREKKNVTFREKVKDPEPGDDDWEEVKKERFAADLLGVAGIDVAIEEIEKHITSHKIVVNGYAFLVTNNGYVIAHPDLRPTFQGMLKPHYNSIDMVEVEMINDERGSRDINPQLIEVRDYIVKNESGKKTLTVKRHFDGMRRVWTSIRHYFYYGIGGTPFSVVLSLPSQYGQHRVHEKLEDPGKNFTKIFRGDWTIHPKWKYCYYYYDNDHKFDSPEQELLHFLNRMQIRGWKWRVLSSHISQSGAISQPNIDSYFCDKELVSLVVHHANITDWFLKNFTGSHRADWLNYKNRFNITLVFLSTYSGLTRWKRIQLEERAYIEKHNKATDEIWYRRAVEFYKENEDGFIYSVPFYSDDEENDYTTTVSIAVFPRRGRKYPFAVTGYRFSTLSLHSLLRNVTYCCPSGFRCEKTCLSDDLDCYLLDNNGYIVASEDFYSAGKFFGEVHGHVLELMVKENIYKRVPVYDYQGVCFRSEGSGNFASYILTPISHLKSIVAKLLWMLLHVLLSPSAYASCEFEDTLPKRSYSTDPPKEDKVYWTRPELCDTHADLYTLNSDNTAAYSRKSDNCKRPFVVQKLVASNLIMVVVNALCPSKDEFYSNTMPTEVQYEQTYRCSQQDFKCNDSLACLKAHYFKFSRRHLRSCHNYHKEESKIKDQCGGCALITKSHKILAMTLAVVFISRTALVSF